MLSASRKLPRYVLQTPNRQPISSARIRCEELVMATTLTESELKAKQIELQHHDLDFQRTKLFIDFAKFGFAGTLTAAVVGMLLVLSLAILSAFTTFKIDAWALVVMTSSILVGCIAFGYLSLWEIPRIAARIQKMQLTVSGGKNGTHEQA
jgi:hypothetical protein